MVIVGAGIAGHRCALELRRCGFGGRVVLIGEEMHAPYDRTLLSKDLLAGAVEPAELALAPEHQYDDLDIDLRLGTPAVALRPEAHEVTLADGTVVDYDQLVIATGGSPARPTAFCDAGGRVLRTLGDALTLRDALTGAHTLVVIGGGFIGAEVAASARGLGRNVTMVEALPAPLAGAVGIEIGERIATLHRERGVELFTGVAACAVRRGGRLGLQVQLADGRVLATETVLVGAGILPQTDWLAGSGVERRRGILVDEHCRTSVPDVLAAGDCTRWFHPHYGQIMHVEHWDTAGQHGVAAARMALGEGEPFAPLPFFWSSQYGIRFQWIGRPGAWDNVTVRDGDAPSSFVARYESDGSLVAAFAAGDARAIVAARRELEATLEVAT
jgi:NADPH-dependent 2,4-dienoyl-CoA reductase/sulfur reductase-like enzyme